MANYFPEYVAPLSRQKVPELGQIKQLRSQLAAKFRSFTRESLSALFKRLGDRIHQTDPRILELNKTTQTNPCQVIAQADAIYHGLESGHLKLHSVNPATNTVLFRGKDNNGYLMDGTHIGIIVEKYGVKDAQRVLVDKIVTGKHGPSLKEHYGRAITMAYADAMVAQGLIDSGAQIPSGVRNILQSIPSHKGCI